MSSSNTSIEACWGGETPPPSPPPFFLADLCTFFKRRHYSYFSSSVFPSCLKPTLSQAGTMYHIKARRKIHTSTKVVWGRREEEGAGGEGDDVSGTKAGRGVGEAGKEGEDWW